MSTAIFTNMGVNKQLPIITIFLFILLVVSVNADSCPSQESTVYLYMDGELAATVSAPSFSSSSNVILLGSRNALYDNVVLEADCTEVASEGFEVDFGCFDAGSISSDGNPGNALLTGGSGANYPECVISGFDPASQTWKLSFDGKSRISGVEYETASGISSDVQINIDTDSAGIPSHSLLSVSGSSTSFDFPFDNDWHSFILTNYEILENYAPIHDTPILTSTRRTDTTNEDLTVTPQNTDDINGDDVRNVIAWYKDSTPYQALYLPFDTESLTDYSGNENTATSTATYTDGYNSFGAYEFNGAEDVTVEDSSSISMTTDSDDVIVMSAWIKSSANTWQPIIIKKGEYSLVMSKTGGFIIYSWGDNSETIGSGYNDDEWHYVVGKFKEGESYSIYVDGALVDTVTTTDTSYAMGYDFEIGAYADNGKYFEGTIDEVITFTHDVSDDQLTALYDSYITGDNPFETIDSEETTLSETWYASVTPTDGMDDGITKDSNEITIEENYAPTHDTPNLESTYGYDTTCEDLTVIPQNTEDSNGNDVKNIISWYKDDDSYQALYMPFDSGVLDYSGNNNLATGSATYTEGYGGFGSYDFEGTTGIVVSDDSSISMTSESDDVIIVSAWIKSDGGEGPIFMKKGEYGLVMNSAGSLVMYSWGDNSGRIGSGYNDGVWHYVVAKFNEGESYILYVDGELVDTIATTDTSSNNGNDLEIGAYDTWGTSFEGIIDEFIIFTHDISDDQLTALYDSYITGDNPFETIDSEETTLGEKWYASVTPTDGTDDGEIKDSNELTIVYSAPVQGTPVLESSEGTNYLDEDLTITPGDTFSCSDVKHIISWYKDSTPYEALSMPFDTESLTDYSGNENTATSTATYTDGYNGFGAYEFNGAEGIIVADDSSISMTSDSDDVIVISAWIKTSNTIWQPIVVKRDEYAFAMSTTGGFIIYTWGDNSGTIGSGYNDGDWHNVVAKYDEGESYSVYVDGALIGSVATTDTTDAGEEDLEIGIYEIKDKYYNGIIDEVIIFTHDVSDDQLTALYDSYVTGENSFEAIDSEETAYGDVWYACVTPTDGIKDGEEECSNEIEITIDLDCEEYSNGGQDYLFCDELLDWESAQETCELTGYTLATIDDSTENEWLAESGETFFSSCCSWIGYNDIDTEGTWEWISGSASTYTAWASGEPNNSGNEDCAYLDVSASKQWWNDLNCATERSFICESEELTTSSARSLIIEEASATYEEYAINYPSTNSTNSTTIEVDYSKDSLDEFEESVRSFEEEVSDLVEELDDIEDDIYDTIDDYENAYEDDDEDDIEDALDDLEDLKDDLSYVENDLDDLADYLESIEDDYDNLSEDDSFTEYEEDDYEERLDDLDDDIDDMYDEIEELRNEIESLGE